MSNRFVCSALQLRGYPPISHAVYFITTQVKVWCTLNHLPVTHIKMVRSHIVVYCMTNQRKAYTYLIILLIKKENVLIMSTNR